YPQSVIDPACGSAVFLIESLRAMSGVGPLRISGIDESQISVTMSRIAMESAVWEHIGSARVVTEIKQYESLRESSWGNPDIIVMNPPFLPWRSIRPDTRESIRTAMGDFYLGHADTAIAFLGKAIANLPAGGVIASVVPAAMLQS